MWQARSRQRRLDLGPAGGGHRDVAALSEEALSFGPIFWAAGYR